jgi:hypothetical protein
VYLPEDPNAIKVALVSDAGTLTSSPTECLHYGRRIKFDEVVFFAAQQTGTAGWFISCKFRNIDDFKKLAWVNGKSCFKLFPIHSSLPQTPISNWSYNIIY